MRMFGINRFIFYYLPIYLDSAELIHHKTNFVEMHFGDINDKYEKIDVIENWMLAWLGYSWIYVNVFLDFNFMASTKSTGFWTEAKI